MQDVCCFRRFLSARFEQPSAHAGMASVCAKRRIAAREPTGPDWMDQKGTNPARSRDESTRVRAKTTFKELPRTGEWGSRLERLAAVLITFLAQEYTPSPRIVLQPVQQKFVAHEQRIHPHAKKRARAARPSSAQQSSTTAANYKHP